MASGFATQRWHTPKRKQIRKLQKQVNMGNTKKNWPLWEIFVRSKNGLEHRHFGSLHAADAEMALENARDVYTRRNEGVSIWVVESKHITASNPQDNGEMFEPAQDKVYRHPTFYDLPDDVKHM